MSRTEFDEKTRVKRLNFCEFKCEGLVTREDGTKTRCNATLVKGRVEFDHEIAAELGGPSTFENCKALCRICHREKYPSDAAKIAKAKRREAADIGARAPSAKSIQGPKFKISPRTARNLSRGPKACAGTGGVARQYQERS